MSWEEKLSSGYRYIKENKHMEAGRIYDQMIRECPDQPIGYIGKAWSLLIAPEACPFDTLEQQILRARGLTCAPEWEVALHRLENVQATEIDTTLLMYMALGCRWEDAALLLELGADVHIKTNTNATALWFVCRKELPESRQTQGRKIAKMLLELGAEVDVTNTGGVALLNSHTDREIAKMIWERHPEQPMGAAPGSKQSAASESSSSFAWGMGLGFGALGIVLGTVMDQFLAGFLWAAVLAVLGALIGYQIDKIRREGKSAVWPAVRTWAIVLAALVVFGLLFAKCAVPEQKEYGYCPNCHSRMETKYIRSDGYCSRCD